MLTSCQSASLCRLLAWLVLGVAGLSHSAPPQVRIVRVDEAPRIDGRLDDAAWDTAAEIRGFTQRDPFEGHPSSELTVVKLCYDESHLFIAMECHDSQPEEMRASVMQRDQSVGADDYVFVLLDPYRRGRDGYYFRTNPNGAMGEGILKTNSSRPLMEWDAIWDADSHRHDSGWTTEIAIPFRSLSFDGQDTWGMNFGRWIPRLQERSKWVGANRNHGVFSLATTGQVHGFEISQRGIGVDFKPYVVAKHTEDDVEDTSGFEFDSGADLFYQITPSLTATFTYNTDFAEAEVDERRVNLTRFPLFFPEKRDFFLDGADQFAFGGSLRSPLAFHSRTVGLSRAGNKVGIQGGAKVTGRQGKLGIGMLGMGLDQLDTLVEDQIWVGRFTYDLLEESRIGTILSHGDPQDNLDNRLIGVDLLLRDSHFQGDQLLTMNSWFMTTDDERRGVGNAYGIEANSPNRPLRLSGSWVHLDEEFEPAMGFVRRRGTNGLSLEVDYFMEPDSRDVIDEYQVKVEFDRYRRLDGRVESGETDAFFIVENRQGAEVYLGPRFEREVLFEDFNILDDLVIPAGDYRFASFGLGYESSSAQPLIWETSARVGDYYDGERFTAELEASIRPNRFFMVDLGTEWTSADLAAGDFDVLINYFNLRVTPTRKLSWNTLLQYDNLSDQIGLNSRIRYLVNPGSDLFLVYNQGFDAEDGEFRSLSSETTAKLGWTFRF